MCKPAIAKVSIIIPLYNAESFIEETLLSVIYQTYANTEIIIIDDHSTDDSYHVAKSFENSKIRVFKNPGKGACAARNFGLELSSGNFIQFLDADDLLSADKIEKQMAILIKDQNKIAVCATSHFNSNPEVGEIRDKDFLYSTGEPVAFLLQLYGASGTPGMVQTSAWLSPRQLIERAGSWDERLHKDQDGEFFCRVVLQSDGIVYVDEVFNYYRKHDIGENIASQKKIEHIQSQLLALQSKEHQLSLHTDSQGFHSAMALQYKWIAIDAWPHFRSIAKKALIKMEAHGGSPFLPVLGGNVIECVKIIFGWKTARALRHFIHSSSLFKRLKA